MKERYHLPISATCPSCSCAFEFTSSDWQPRAQFMNHIENMSIAPYLGSEYGFVAMDMDCHFMNYMTKKSVLLEIKSRSRMPDKHEYNHLLFMSESLSHDPNFFGVVVIQNRRDGSLNDVTNLYALLDGQWKLIGDSLSVSGLVDWIEYTLNPDEQTKRKLLQRVWRAQQNTAI